MLEQFTQTLSSSPWIAVVAVVLVLFIVIGLVKKLIKVALVFMVGLGLLVGYAIYSGQELPSSVNEIKQTIQHRTNLLKEKSVELTEKVTDKVTEKAKEEAGKIVNEAFNQPSGR